MIDDYISRTTVEEMYHDDEDDWYPEEGYPSEEDEQEGDEYYRDCGVE